MSRLLELSLAALACLCACGPPPASATQDVEAEAQRYASAVCGARSSCSCEDDGRFESQEACESEYFTLFVAAVEDGMSLDLACLDKLVESEAMTCAAWPWEEFNYGECRVLSRKRGVGEPCAWHSKLQPAYVNDCAEGLLCHTGACVEEITFELEVGAPCEQGVGQPCVWGAYCGADDLCHLRGALGEPCTDFFGCGTEQYCAGYGSTGVGTCTMRRAFGELCDPRDWIPCEPVVPDSIWKGCRRSGEEYRCADEIPGICYLTFPLAH